MKVRVLGAGAGGGLPQWNCGCRNCQDARLGRIPSMTQSSVAVSPDGAEWVLLNASPDVRMQLARDPVLAPKTLRASPLEAVILTNGDIDHIAGLLSLREKCAYQIYASREILEIIETNSVFRVLDPEFVTSQAFALDKPFEPVPGLEITPFSVPGKVALFLEGDTVALAEVGEWTVGLILRSAHGTVAYVPGCAALPDWLLTRLRGVDLLLFDGTVWENDDMLKTGTGQKTGARMGHIPMNGPGGSLERLSELTTRKIYIHINNTNPVLQPRGPEAQVLKAKGWEMAQDMMEIAVAR
ncbi:MAG: pyrroloquinoline quinone biosynthesis protein PqqB [Pseudomonadota bacterium]